MAPAWLSERRAVLLPLLTAVALIDGGKVNGAHRLKVGLPQADKAVLAAGDKAVAGLRKAEDGAVVGGNGAEQLALLPRKNVARDGGRVRHAVGAKRGRELAEKVSRSAGGAAVWRQG